MLVVAIVILVVAVGVALLLNDFIQKTPVAYPFAFIVHVSNGE